MLAKSAHQNAGRVFMAYVQSEAGQKVLAGKGLAGSPRIIEGAMDSTGSEIIHTEKIKPETVKAWEQRFDEYFRR